MERYYIIPKDGETNIIYGGDYAEALDFAADLLKIPDGKAVSDYADILTESEYDKKYKITLTPEEKKLLLTALCAYVNTTNADIARCSAPDALPTEKRLLEYYQHQKALNAQLRAKLNK